MSHSGRRGTTFLLSLVFHAGLAFALVVLPLLAADALPIQNASVVTLGPLALAPPPPPPARIPSHRLLERPAATVDPRLAFVEPAVPAEPEPDDFLGSGDSAGIHDGVEGGDPNGVIGSVIGELPTSMPPPPPRVVRINSGIAPPRLVRRVEPAYPAIAVAARLSARVELEAEVDVRGEVASVHVERGHPLFDEAAVAAVRQWRYQPLLLNGEPTAFILAVTVRFDLQR